VSTRDERLQRFFGGYFHQDWDLDAKTWQGVIANYVEEHPRDDTVELRDDLRTWLDEGHSRLPASFRCDYNPQPEGLTDRSWIDRMIAVIVERLGSDDR
jgi:hypothetical protein